MITMPWWLDLLLMAGAFLLWARGSNSPDDVWRVFQKAMAFVAVMVVLLGGRQLLLEVLVLGLALWLPSAARVDQASRVD